MRVFIIDTRNMGPDLQGGLIGVVGSTSPSAEEKRECIETVGRYAVDGWAIASDPRTPIGRLAALTAETACVPFVALERGGPVAVGEGFALVVLDHLLHDPLRRHAVSIDQVDGNGRKSCFAGGEDSTLSGTDGDLAVAVAVGKYGGEDPILLD
jgi:hypothetical protein